MKKILIISTSPRKDGYSDTLAHEFERGALEVGNQVEYISLIGKDIHFCRGCMACLNFDIKFEPHRHQNLEIIL